MRTQILRSVFILGTLSAQALAEVSSQLSEHWPVPPQAREGQLSVFRTVRPHQGSLLLADGLIGLSQPVHPLHQRLQKVRKAKPKHPTVSHIKSFLRKLMRQDQSIPSLQPAQKGPAGLRGERQVPVQNHQMPS